LVVTRWRIWLSAWAPWAQLSGHRLLQRLPRAEPDAGKDGGHHQADAGHGVPGQRRLGEAHRQQHREAGADDGRQGQPHDGEEARQHAVPQGQPLGRRQRSEAGRRQKWAKLMPPTHTMTPARCTKSMR
jgi:hypothetical protein